MIFSGLKIPELNALSEVNKQLGTDTASAKKQNQLLLAVIRGEPDKAEKILQSYPEFLLYNTANAIDYSGRVISGLTPFQAALCAGDLEMCKMIKYHFLHSDKILNGQETLSKQFNQIFPNGIESHTKQQADNVFDFSTIFEAIRNAPMDEIMQTLDNLDADTPLNDALKAFRKQFDEKSHSEKVVNPEHVLAAFTLYIDNFFAFTNFYPRDVFWRRVIGYAQRYLSAYHAQFFAEDFQYQIRNINEGERCTRSFTFKYGGEFIFPLIASGKLGFEWAVGSPGGVGGGQHGSGRAMARSAGVQGDRAVMTLFRELCQKTTTGLEKICIAGDERPWDSEILSPWQKFQKLCKC